MTKEQHHVREFMAKADQEMPDRPTMPSTDVRVLRIKLILEELMELAEAFGGKLVGKADGSIMFEMTPESLAKANLRDAYDAVLDIEVVNIGTGIAIGTDLEPGWEAVHVSNMSKFIDGHKDANGKWRKGPSYAPVRLQPILDAQTRAAEERDRQGQLA